MQTTIKAGHGKMKAEIKTGMEETEVTELAANEEKIQAIAEPYNGHNYLQGRASDVLHGIPKEETY
jgi:hypothetical protein